MVVRADALVVSILVKNQSVRKFERYFDVAWVLSMTLKGSLVLFSARAPSTNGGVRRLCRPHCVEQFGDNGATSLNGAATLGDEAIDAIAITGAHDTHSIWHNESIRRRQSR